MVEDFIYKVRLQYFSYLVDFILRFMWFLFDHLEEGSFRPAYADTDSMCLALSKSQPSSPDDDLETSLRKLFDPIVKTNMKQSWETKWKSWFVTSDDVEDQRCPGKMKSKSTLYYTV